MNTALTAFISPRDQRTAVVEVVGDAESLHAGTVLINGQRVALGDYLARHPATAFWNVSSTDELPVLLKNLSDQASALDFCLMLFDEELSLPLRRRAAGELETLLSYEKNQHYVLDIMLAHPLPQNTDFSVAAAAAEGQLGVEGLVRLLKETRQRSELAFRAWLVFCSRPSVLCVGVESTRSWLLQSGFLRRAVVELTTQADVRERGSVLIRGTPPGLSEDLLQEFLTEYSVQLPRGKSDIRRPAVQPMPDADAALPART
jgi:hypothetical protein